MSGTGGGGVRGVADVMAGSNDVQEDLLLDLRAAADAGDFAAAGMAFDRFAGALRRHMEAEDQLLLPLLDSRTPELAPAVALMRAEHVFIRAMMAAMDASLFARDVHGFRHAFEQLGRVLPAHEARESRMLYPALERTLTTSERAALSALLANRL